MVITILYRAVLSFTLVFLLVGCETMSTRSCPSFEGSPDFESWATYSIGDTLTYVSDKGRSESYTLRSIEGNSTYDETDFGETEDILCRATVAYLFESSGGDHYLSQFYTIIDRENVALTDRPLYIELTAMDTPDSSAHAYTDLRFMLSDPIYTMAGNSSTAEAEVTFSATREVGQITYQDVFEIRLRDMAIDLSTPPESTLTRVVFARNAGLIEFEFSDKQVFTLVQP